MTVSSRTPEGSPNRCPLCGREVRLEPSASGARIADAPCPYCGCLLWFDGPGPPKATDAIADVKRRIRGWLHHIEQLSDTATDADAYYKEMLTGLITMLAALGGAVWTRDAKRLRLRIAVGAGTTENFHRTLLEPWHRRLLERAFAEGAAAAIGPNEQGQRDDDRGNPTESLLLLGTVKKKHQTVALVEIFQRTGASPTIERGYLRFIQQICELAGGSSVIGDAEV